MTRRTPPTPTGHPVVGNTIQFASDAFGFVEDARAACGDAFAVDLLGPETLYVLAAPEHARRVLDSDADAFGKTADFRRAFGEGLVSVEGETWRRQRQLLQPHFYRDRIASYVPTMVRRTRRRLDTWADGDRLDVEEEMSALALEVLFATLFGRELAVDGDDRLRRSAADLNGWFEPSSWALPAGVPTPARRRFRRAKAHLRETVDGLIEDRMGEPADADDLLATLVRGRAAGGLSRETLTDQLVTFVFAGHETTAKAMSFAWYLLATHPDARERFHEELAATLGGDDPTAADLRELPFTDRVLREAMRLYPPVHTIPRRTTREVEVGDYRLPADREVHLSVYLLHRNGAVYDDPLAFRPDRWRDDDRPAYGYLPFGGGRRRCIGQEFALAEAKAVLATVGQRYRLEWPREEPLAVEPAVTTRIAGDATMSVHERR